MTGPGVEIVLVHGSEREARGRADLLHLFAEHDLRRWAYVRNVHFDDEALKSSCEISCGHPRITLRPMSDELRCRLGERAMTMLLSLYLHEQLHMYLKLHEAAARAAIGEVKARYPVVPVGGVEGARSAFSTYLHLVLCALELNGLAECIGMQAARDLKSHSPFYRFIYREILADPEYFDALLRDHHLRP